MNSGSTNTPWFNEHLNQKWNSLYGNFIGDIEIFGLSLLDRHLTQILQKSWKHVCYGLVGGKNESKLLKFFVKMDVEKNRNFRS